MLTSDPNNPEVTFLIKKKNLKTYGSEMISAMDLKNVVLYTRQSLISLIERGSQQGSTEVGRLLKGSISERQYLASSRCRQRSGRQVSGVISM